MNEETNKKKAGLFQNSMVQSIVGVVVILLVLGGFLFWQSSSGTVFIENSYVNAPIISLSSSAPGTLNALYVSEGETVAANTPVALVGTNIVTSKQSGIITGISNTMGAFFAPGQTVVSMIHPEDMRIVGTIDETKGLDEIKAGQNATFTVDTFGSKTYVGKVESVSETSDDTGVVFSISDKRPTKKFDVKVLFDVNKYPELKNGMSAKITVYVN